MNLPGAAYQEQYDRHALVLRALEQHNNRFGWLRLLLIVVTAVAAFQVFQLAGAWGWLVLGAGIGLFLWLVSNDADNSRKLQFTKALVGLNKEELSMLAHRFDHRPGGAEYAPAAHAYAADLDLFGTGSLFQLLNRCAGEQSRERIAGNLLHPLPVSEIKLRQEAVEELAPMLEWRQELQANATATPLSAATERRLANWLQQPDGSLQHPAWRWFIGVYTGIACGITLAAIFEIIPGAIFSLCFFVFIICSFVLGKKATPTSVQLSKIVDELAALEGVLRCLERPKFITGKMRRLQQALLADGRPASVQIRDLKDILNRFDLRLNVFLFIFLNALLLWDLRQLRSLQAWRQRNTASLSGWFDAIAEAEVLNSLATLRFNKPTWVQPVFTPVYCHFEAKALGHPLLSDDQRVSSDFTLTGQGKVALVTGSNMAGKSTFLRSIGVNMVLAQMGAVVCAKGLTCSPVALLSSMRIADNLAENTSTFYAELKKLKTIIEAVRAKQPVLVLLDEILRGTNSLDRHTGSKALIRQVIREGSVAVLATHDVALARLEQEFPDKLENYHFDVQVEGEELYFDYQLKHGVCTNLNASVLMRKIGIELD